jgi:hypothetical protein
MEVMIMSIKVLRDFISIAKVFNIPINPINLRKYKNILDNDK